MCAPKMPRTIDNAKETEVLAPERIKEATGTPEKKPGDDREGPKGPRIRCPLCGWRPGAHDRWMCHCGHLWNTFETGGVCPGCLYQWKVTACPACNRWSAHSDWYAQD